jgi:putative tryptophan/tyrosine transport system substrate-binding protein
VGAGFVESLTASGGNITGASDAVPLSAQFKPFLKQFKIKKLAVLFNPREKNSNQQLQGLQQAAKNYGFDVIELPSPPALDRLQQNLKSLGDGQVKVDAVYLPADSFLLSQAGLIGPQLRAAKIKSLAALQGFVDQGALMGVVPNYRELGEALARMIDENRKGKPLDHIPVYFTQQPTLVINTATAAALGIEIPAAVQSKAILVTGPQHASSG